MKREITPSTGNQEAFQPTPKALAQHFWESPTAYPLERYDVRIGNLVNGLDSAASQGYTDTLKAIFRKIPEGTVALFLQYEYMAKGFENARRRESLEPVDPEMPEKMHQTGIGFEILAKEEIERLGIV